MPPRRKVVRRDTFEMLRDRQVLARAALSFFAAWFDSVRPRLLQATQAAFASGSGFIPNALLDAKEQAGRARALAELLAASEIAGRLRARKQAKAEEPSIHSSLGFARDENRSAVFTETVPRSIPPEQAIAHIRSLPAVKRAQWEAFVRKHQQRAFTLAGVEQQRVLKDLRELIARSLEKGLTAPQFDAAAQELLRNYQVSGRRLRLLWNDTVTNALRDGRQAELADPEIRAVLSFQLFDAIVDAVVRPNHEAMEGALAPVDWWEGPGRELMPALGHNCRCQLIPLTAARAARLVEQGGPYLRIDLEGPRAGAGPDEDFAKLFAERRAA